jgi:carboxymethylenebutenolidase
LKKGHPMKISDCISEFEGLLPARQFSRRDVMGAVTGLGFAAAVLPVSAQTITTDTTGIAAKSVKIPVGKETVSAYCAHPEKPAGDKKKWPLVLVISEVFGLHEHIADVTRRFAKEGYFAIAPELFSRQGDAKTYADLGKLLSDIISKVPDEQVFRDLDATLAWAGNAGADLDRAGVTGFCWGGRMTWLTAARTKVKAGVAWYGRLVGESTALTPRHPIDIAGTLNAPVLGLYGAQDNSIPLDTIDKMKTALAKGNAASKASEFVVYPQAGHAFNADYRPSYQPEAAADGWKRCLAWLRANGV